MSHDPWDGAEPFVMVGEMRACNGTTVAGDAVLHTKRCPLHGTTPEVEIAAAERRGYERAVARLRDAGVLYDSWLAAQPFDEDLANDEPSRQQLADYLDAVKESTDG